MLILHVHVHVLEDQVEAFRQATIDNARNSLLEPGVVRFDVIERQDDPTRFVLVEIYREAQGFDSHKQTEHYLRWRDAVAPMMAEPRTALRYDAVCPADVAGFEMAGARS